MKMNQYKNGRYLLDFYADWCGPCKMMKPAVQEFDDQVDEVSVEQINVDQKPELASVFGVRNIPMVIYIEDGEIVSKGLGIKSIDQLKVMCNVSK